MNNQYHDWLWFTLIIISGLWIVFSIIVSSADGEKVISFICMMFIGAFFIGFWGWAVIGYLHSVVNIQQTNSATVITTPSSIILTLQDKPIKTITDVPTYQYLKNKTNVNVIEDGRINIYGNTIWYHNYQIDYSGQSK